MKAAHYVRRIESFWSQLVEAPVVVSVREFALIAEWHARGIPLELILETIEEAVRRRREKKRPPPRSLAYLRQVVEEAWSVVREGRLEPGGARVAPGAASAAHAARARWQASRDAAATGAPLRRLLDDLLARLAAGAAAAEIDDELDARLVEAVGVERCRPVQRVVDERLAPFRQRMSGKVFEATRRRAVVERLRRELDLPALVDPGTEASSAGA